MAPGGSPAVSPGRPVLRVAPLPTGGWRVTIDGLPPSDYASKEEACAEAEAYVAGHGRGGEIVVGAVTAAGAA